MLMNQSYVRVTVYVNFHKNFVNDFVLKVTGLKLLNVVPWEKSSVCHTGTITISHQYKVVIH